MKFKKMLSLALSAILAVSMLASCGENGEEKKEEEEEDKGAIIDMYFGEMPEDLDPTNFSVNSDKYQITTLMFEGLFEIGNDGKLIGAGAEKWEYGVDERDGQMKLTIKLRNSRWSDSIPVRADDYVFAWKRILAPANSNPAASLLYPVKNASKVKSGEVTVADIGAFAVSENTLEIVFEEGYTDVEYFLRTLASPMLVPLREDKVKSDTWTSQLDLLVTNGPFAVKSMSPDRLLLERSTHYHALRTRQKLTTYVNPYRILAYFDNEEEAVEKFNEGKYFYLSNFSQETYESFGKSIKSAPDLTTYTYFFNTNNPLLADKATRQALSGALDREEIAALRGAGAAPATGLVPTGVKEAGSKKEYRAAGENLISYEGAKVKETGKITLTYNKDRAYEEKIADYARKAWKGLGFTVETVGVTTEEIKSIIKSGEFDVIAADYMAFTEDAYGFVAPFSKKFSGMYVDVTNPDVFYNPHFTGFESEKYDEIIEQLFTADTKARAALMHSAEEMLCDEAPVAPLFFENIYYVKSGKLSKIGADFRNSPDFRETALKGYKAVNEAKRLEEEAEKNAK